MTTAFSCGPSTCFELDGKDLRLEPLDVRKDGAKVVQMQRLGVPERAEGTDRGHTANLEKPGCCARRQAL